FSTHHVARRSHRPRDDAEYSGTGRRGTLPVDDDFRFRSVREAMTLAPRKVVMVLDVEHHVDPKGALDTGVNQLVIGRGVPAHQLHCGKVLLARFGRQVQPRKMRQLLRKLRVEIAREPAVLLRYLRTRAAAARVAEEREVRALREAHAVVED